MSRFSGACTDASLRTAFRARAMRIAPAGSVMLACILLCVLLYHLPATTAMAQEPTPAPAQTSVTDTTKPAGPVAPERIEIRIELPIVEPFFNIFYEREEPKIQPDPITPAANPLQKLPPAVGEISQEKFHAQRLEKRQELLDRQRE